MDYEKMIAAILKHLQQDKEENRKLIEQSGITKGFVSGIRVGEELGKRQLNTFMKGLFWGTVFMLPTGIFLDRMLISALHR